MKEIIERTKQLASQCNALSFSFDGFVYNPLDYAWNNHREFLHRYIDNNPKAILLGMNPGPFGMIQTGVPFGEVDHVINYLKLTEDVNSPKEYHPNRPIDGLLCKRNEISGKRVWSLFEEYYPNPLDFPKDFAVINYCPLGFLSSCKTAKNITPDKLEKEERIALESICDSYLTDVIDILNPKFLIGVGKYAQSKLEKVNKDHYRIVESIIHPSPGNPMANNGWAEKTKAKFVELGIWK